VRRGRSCKTDQVTDDWSFPQNYRFDRVCQLAMTICRVAAFVVSEGEVVRRSLSVEQLGGSGDTRRLTNHWVTTYIGDHLERVIDYLRCNSVVVSERNFDPKRVLAGSRDRRPVDLERQWIDHRDLNTVRVHRCIQGLE